MKYLKFFESWDYIEDIIETLKEMLIPIRDLGYNSYIQYIPLTYTEELDTIRIRILTYLDAMPLDITKDIIEDFDRINYYLESEGFQMIVKGVTVFNADIELSYGRFINEYLKNTFSIKVFRNLLFVAQRKDK